MMSVHRPVSFDGNQLVCDILEVEEIERVAYIKENNFHTLKINDAQDTLLHFASESGNIEVLKLLIEGGSDVDAQNIYDQTPLIISIEKKPHRFLEVIDILYQNNANIHLSDKSGKNAVQLVLGDHNCIYENLHEFFLQIIHYESVNDSQETAKKLVDMHYPICLAILLREAQVIEQMIKLHCSVDSRHPYKSYTAISKAVEVMDLKIVQVLAKFNANVDLRDSNNFHPIFHYASNTLGNIQCPEIIDILLSKSIQLKDVYADNLIYQFKNAFVFGNQQVIQMLLNYHEDILSIRDRQGQTAMHYLSRNCHLDISQVLKGRKVDVNVKDEADRTPLFISTEYPKTPLSTYKFLLCNGANVNARAQYPFVDVPLFSICQNGSMTKESCCEIIELFLQHGLDVQFIGLNKKTVFDIIVEYETFYIAKPLVAHLALLDEMKQPINGCIRNKILSCKIFKKLFDVCQTELENMKNFIITDALNLYTLVVDKMTEEKVLKRCRFNSNALSNFKKLKKNFNTNNYYYAKVEKCISAVISKLELLQTAAPIMCRILNCKNDPGSIVVNEILDYLENEDLKTLTKLYT